VEAEGEQGAPALDPLITSSNIHLGERKGVAEVQLAVHVRVREGAEPLGWRAPVSGSIELEDLLLLPLLGKLRLIGADKIAFLGFLSLGGDRGLSLRRIRQVSGHE